MTKIAQLVGRQPSRVDAGRLAVLIGFGARPKWMPGLRLVAAFGGSTLDRDGRRRQSQVCT
jgi:hypothetical protein